MEELLTASSEVQFSLEGHKLAYRGEGNGSVVVAVGDTGKILRLAKVNSTPPTSGQHVALPPLFMRDDLHRLVRFITTSVRPLLGQTFIHSGEIVGLGVDDLIRLNRELESVRPDFRKVKSIAEVESCALLMPDLCSSHTLKLLSPHSTLCGPILTVEIKPKMGFTLDKTGSNLTRPCKYSLMQKWKINNKKINEVSKYCPLDLFSGCHLRFRRALHDLCDNPQNNLRLFLDGELVFGDGTSGDINQVLRPFFQIDSGLFDRLCELISKAIFADHPHLISEVELSTINGQQSCECKKDQNFQGIEVDHNCFECRLPIGCVLNRILHMQKLSSIDAQSLLPIYEKWKDKLEQTPLEKLYELLYINTQPIPADFSTKLDFDGHHFEGALQTIRDYLLSSTAKDCSIMMTFSKSSEKINTEKSNAWIICLGESKEMFVHSTVIVDLDCKSHHRIPEHANLEDNLGAESIRNLLITGK